MMKRSGKTGPVLLVLLVFCCAFFCSCGKKEAVIGVQGLPDTLDPQIETSISAQELFLCAFRGLVSEENNALVCDAAESYTYSADGLVLTFQLRQGLTWSDGVAVTADDYAFAIERILSPETGSSYASLLLSIDGAAEFYARTASSLRGVSCPDDRTLQIRLCSSDDRLLRQFAATYLSPCRRDFFEQTSGAYGMTVSKTVFNGDYRVSSKGSETAVLTRISQEKTLPKTVRFRDISAYSAQTLEEQLLSGDLTAAVSNDAIAQNDRLEVLDFTDSVYFLAFGNREGFAGDAVLRQTLASVSVGQLQKENQQASVLPASYYRYWYGSDAAALPLRLDGARATLNTLLEKHGLSQHPKIVMLVADDDVSRTVSDQLVTLWQKHTGLFVSREYLSQGSIRARVRKGDFDCAVFCGESYSATVEGYYSAISAQFGYLGLVRVSDEAAAEREIIAAYETAFAQSGQVFALGAKHSYFYCTADSDQIRLDIATGCIRVN